MGQEPLSSSQTCAGLSSYRQEGSPQLPGCIRLCLPYLLPTGDRLLQDQTNAALPQRPPRPRAALRPGSHRPAPPRCRRPSRSPSKAGPASPPRGHGWGEGSGIPAGTAVPQTPLLRPLRCPAALGGSKAGRAIGLSPADRAPAPRRHLRARRGRTGSSPLPASPEAVGPDGPDRPEAAAPG